MNEIQTLIGPWYLAQTNFGMWKHNDITSVTFNYSPAEKNGVQCLFDEVKYVKQGKNKSVNGYDFYDANNAGKFIWQGKGWMFWIKCPWQVEWISADKNCLILSFEKTLLTGGGVDILTRDKNPAIAILDEALSVINKDQVLRRKALNSFRFLQK